jgi:hypothetical protein
MTAFICKILTRIQSKLFPLDNLKINNAQSDYLRWIYKDGHAAKAKAAGEAVG